MWTQFLVCSRYLWLSSQNSLKNKSVSMRKIQFIGLSTLWGQKCISIIKWEYPWKNIRIKYWGTFILNKEGRGKKKEFKSLTGWEFKEKTQSEKSRNFGHVSNSLTWKDSAWLLNFGIFWQKSRLESLWVRFRFGCGLSFL